MNFKYLISRTNLKLVSDGLIINVDIISPFLKANVTVLQGRPSAAGFLLVFHILITKMYKKIVNVFLEGRKS